MSEFGLALQNAKVVKQYITDAFTCFTHCFKAL